jgi:hypothetical protein
MPILFFSFENIYFKAERETLNAERKTLNAERKNAQSQGLTSTLYTLVFAGRVTACLLSAIGEDKLES